MSKFRTFTLWFLILFVAVLFLSGGVVAQDSAPNQPADPAALPFGSSMSASSPAPDHVAAVTDWSMLTYQKLLIENLISNWDIYVHDKSGPRRLTYDKRTDRHPDLDRGSKRVAFLSDRYGDYDLFTVKVDGTGLQRIFDTASDTAFPEWSPDGRHIALQVIVDGQYELYVVNADGSSPQRLTNHSKYDGMPAWSPDGTQMAFVSNRSGDYRVYVMNVDGSGLRLLSSLPFSLHPTWSPDGLKIGFDADVDGDGWQELALIGADGGNEHVIYDPGDTRTAWANSWSPDNTALAFTEITAELQNNEWIWTRGVIRTWELGSGVIDLIAGGSEWYADWETTDTTAPLTTIEPLPTYSAAKNFIIRWSGDDFGGSGIKSYALYYDDGSGWKTYWGHTTSTQAPFPAQPGTTVQFLVRAIDNAMNQESWQPQNIEETTFYNTMAAGTITDNRGNPLSGVPVNSSPPFAFFPVVSDLQGHFTGYTIPDTAHTLSIQEPNFMPMPNTTMAAGSDFLHDIYLLPKDTLIRNGTFEKSASTPTDWTIGGSLPVAISSKEFATGKYAVRLGQAAAANAPNDVQTAGTASISQEFTVLSNMNRPTLSYMARAAAGQPPANSELHILILPDTATVPTEIKKPLSSQWSLDWIDMNPWLGQKVTVTFEMVQGAADPAQTFYLDDISLGGISPDLWIGLANSPAMALPGEQVDLTLEFGNRGPAMAKNAFVELALPAELSLVSATPPYTINNNVLRWQVGDLAPHSAAKQLSAVVTPLNKIQQSVLAKATIDSTTVEVHLRNNEDETSILINKSLYLPIVLTP